MTAVDRHNIIRAIEASLKRLGTDYIDLYQTHWPDHGTGYDEIVWIERAMVERGFEPPVIHVHSANSSARQRMEAGIASIVRPTTLT